MRRRQALALALVLVTFPASRTTAGAAPSCSAQEEAEEGLSLLQVSSERVERRLGDVDPAMTMRAKLLAQNVCTHGDSCAQIADTEEPLGQISPGEFRHFFATVAGADDDTVAQLVPRHSITAAAFADVVSKILIVPPDSNAHWPTANEKLRSAIQDYGFVSCDQVVDKVDANQDGVVDPSEVTSFVDLLRCLKMWPPFGLTSLHEVNSLSNGAFTESMSAKAFCERMVEGSFVKESPALLQEGRRLAWRTAAHPASRSDLLLRHHAEHRTPPITSGHQCAQLADTDTENDYISPVEYKMFLMSLGMKDQDAFNMSPVEPIKKRLFIQAMSKILALPEYSQERPLTASQQFLNSFEGMAPRNAIKLVDLNKDEIIEPPEVENYVAELVCKDKWQITSPSIDHEVYSMFAGAFVRSVTADKFRQILGEHQE